jgi:hypothetical protein
LLTIYQVPHFWIPWVGWGVANDVARYKTSWGTFQVRYFRVTGENLKFPRLKIMIVIISVGCLLCAVLFIVSLSFLLDGFPLWHTWAYCKKNYKIYFTLIPLFFIRSHNDDVKHELSSLVYQFSWHQSCFGKFITLFS